MTDTIDDKLMIVTDQEKIQASDIEGTFYTAGSLGGGSMNVRITNQTTAQNTKAAGTIWGFNATLQTQSKIIMNPLMLFSVYVDNDNDPDYLWPDGASLTASNTPRIDWNMSEANTDPKNGYYTWSFAIKNESAITRTYYFKLRLIMPIIRV